ncbi:MAG: hypothetical protein KDK36_01585 [Leptospiraceae bacterium]|nr:hypothetical protein [Leptospiraceae bacterium]
MNIAKLLIISLYINVFLFLVSLLMYVSNAVGVLLIVAVLCIGFIRIFFYPLEEHKLFENTKPVLIIAFIFIPGVFIAGSHYANFYYYLTSKSTGIIDIQEARNFPDAGFYSLKNAKLDLAEGRESSSRRTVRVHGSGGSGSRLRTTGSSFYFVPIVPANLQSSSHENPVPTFKKYLVVDFNLEKSNEKEQAEKIQKFNGEKILHVRKIGLLRKLKYSPNLDPNYSREVVLLDYAPGEIPLQFFIRFSFVLLLTIVVYFLSEKLRAELA